MSIKYLKLSELRKTMERVHRENGLEDEREEVRKMAQAMTPGEFYGWYMIKELELDIEFRFDDFGEYADKTKMLARVRERVYDILNDHRYMVNWFIENPFRFDDDGDADEPDYTINYVLDVENDGII